MAALETYSPFTTQETAVAPLLSKGKRQDERFPEEFRQIFIKTGTVSSAAGSAYVEFKDTKVMCSVFGPRKALRTNAVSADGQLNCDVRFATFAAAQRQRFVQGTLERDCTTLLQNALEGAVIRESFPKASVDVQVLVLEANGGEAPAIITCASAALAHAGIQMRDLVTACSAAHVGEELLLDPTDGEERRAEGAFFLALMPQSNEVTHLSLTGEWTPQSMAEAMELCTDGCVGLDSLVRDCLRATPPSRNTKAKGT
ncbi:hypothetical protein CYMTET_8469 [Cymbomonas tetramitiformis]|uniref:Uncharacterized protein n=1 Tax=Cymbomonas tetramitiformis TaxID=36881 RepID=A0AAE0GT86_9CHLO|nr:hypothetical protein CYMTET_26758 [Cymbomonas tetramitiformis]KAK3283852.1 hypothetical protein CYMTET_8469 [Cymbomonas tetramitiformis]